MLESRDGIFGMAEKARMLRLRVRGSDSDPTSSLPDRSQHSSPPGSPTPWGTVPFPVACLADDEKKLLRLRSCTNVLYTTCTVLVVTVQDSWLEPGAVAKLLLLERAVSLPVSLTNSSTSRIFGFSLFTRHMAHAVRRGA